MSESQYKALEQKIDELIELCAELNRENFSLKAEAYAWEEEKQRLVDNNALARTKVEAMISRLKALEQEP